MSKSIGNVVNPNMLINTYGCDTVRSYFLSEGPLYKDSNFDEEKLRYHHNHFIIDSYCNLIISYNFIVNILFRTTGKKIIKKLPKLTPVS